MTKTGQPIEDDIYGMVNASSLPSLITGKVYKFGMRPKDSPKEDAIVKFVTGLDGQIQEGVVVVLIYVPDFDFYDDGVMRKDITRCTEIERAAAEWVASLTAEKSDYKFRLAQTIYTEEEPSIHQHFVSIRLNFRLPTI
jgi:hypothetical protein